MGLCPSNAWHEAALVRVVLPAAPPTAATPFQGQCSLCEHFMGIFFLSTLLFKPPLFFLLCSFFLILYGPLGALGAHMRSSTQSLTSYPQPAVLGEGESLPWPQQGFKPSRGWRLEPQVVLGREGGAGWHRGAWARTSSGSWGRARAGGRPLGGTKSFM